jgi:hypothetical protein
MSSLDPDLLDAAILGLLLARHPAPVHVTDLALAFPNDDWAASVAALAADGALHAAGDLLVVARGAVRTAELLG